MKVQERNYIFELDHFNE